MDEQSIEQAAELLVGARRDNRVIDAIPDEIRPRTLADAYVVQDRFISLLGAPTGGWFGACTNTTIQELLGLSEPYHARLLADHMFPSPATLSAADYPPMVFECEFGFVVDRDFTPDSTPYSQAEIEAAIIRVCPTIEVVAGHLKDWPSQDVFSVIADNGTDGALIHGPGIADWRGIDLPGTEVALEINGESVRQGRGANVLGDPLRAFVWLVNAVTRAGHTVRAGEICNTGTATDIYWTRPGEHAVARFGPIGHVDLRIV